VATELLPASAVQPRAEFTLRRARALAISGRCAESLALLRDLLDRWPADQPGLRAETAALCAAMQRFLGRHDESLALLEAELARLPDQETREALALKLELTYGCLHGSRWPETFAWAAQVLATSARHPGRTLDAAGGTGLRALGAAQAGDPAAWEHLAHAAALLDSVPDGELAERLNVAAEIAWVEVLHGAFHDARRHYARGVALARRGGQYQILVTLLYGLGSTDTWLGRLSEAADGLDSALAVARTLGERNLYPAVLARWAEVAFLRGDLDVAADYVARSIREQPTGTYLWTGHAELIRARIRLADATVAGDPALSIDELLRVGGGPDLTFLSSGARSLWYDVLAQAELARDRVAAANAWADRSVARPVLPGVLGVAPLTRARVLLAGATGATGATAEPGAAAAAAILAGRTAEHAARVGARIVEADARRVRGAALSVAGELSTARDELRRAKDIYAACGAQRLHTDVAAEQRALASRGRRGRRRDATAPAGLTEREKEIAGLVALGQSNRQIAEKLALSPRTVETHLSHVFTKLGLATRSALARHIHEQT
jgi:ATP/maltotriose-dependent transcriptional regulator MalT